MRKLSIIVVSCVGIIAAGVLWIAYTTTAKQTSDQAAIERGFDDIGAQVNQRMYMEAGRSGIDSLSITPEQFLFYKMNIELFHHVTDSSSAIPNDQQLLDNLLKKKLVVQKALELGITVEDQEVEDYIAEQKNIYEQFQAEEQGDRIAYEFMKNRIRITGLSEEQFWNSNVIRETYYEAILGSKLRAKLLADGTLSEPEQFNQFQEELLIGARDMLPRLEDVQQKK